MCTWGVQGELSEKAGKEIKDISKIAEFHLQVWSVEVPLAFPFVFPFDCFFLFTFLPVPFLCSALFIFLFPFLVLVLFILFLFMYFEACLNPPPLVGLWSHKVHAKSCKRVWVWGVKHYQHKLKAGAIPLITGG